MAESGMDANRGVGHSFFRRTQALSMLLDDGRLYFEKVFS
jgi:hypothetical protein